MTRNTREKIIKIFAIVSIAGLIISTFAGGLLALV